MANSTDYLRFSAYSIKDLITRKLTADKNYTDQIYEGSNLAVLIDIVSYMYQCLIYNLNSAAAESMWSDTQIYENINRLCKFLGYNPGAVKPATVTVSFESNTSVQQKQIYPYSYVQLTKTDSNGNAVCYSTIEPITINNSDIQSITLTNGKWKRYSTIFTASGLDFETFTLTDIQSDDANYKFVTNTIHVYVKHQDGTVERWYAADSELFASSPTSSNSVVIYDKNDKYYNIRLNENKQFEIKFGDNINCRRLETNDQLYIFYLDCNGVDGEIVANDIQDLKFNHSPADFNISRTIYNQIFNISENATENPVYSEEYGIKVTNQSNSSSYQAEETVDQIRQNAPNWFKLGRRLITEADYIYFIKNLVKNDIVDVICQNNWTYLSTFYKWLYGIGTTNHNNGKYYLNKQYFMKYDYIFADPADNDNVYLWIKPNQNFSSAELLGNLILPQLEQIKCMTSEPVILDPIIKMFAICAAPVEKAQSYFEDDVFDQNYESYIEVTLDPNVIYSTTKIKNDVAQILRDYFTETNHKFGEKIDYGEILQKIYALNGVTRIRTVYKPAGGTDADVIIRNGLSFAAWSNSFIEIGDDMEVSNQSNALEAFQFPELYDVDLEKRIKVIKQTASSVNAMQY